MIEIVIHKRFWTVDLVNENAKQIYKKIEFNRISNVINI